MATLCHYQRDNPLRRLSDHIGHHLLVRVWQPSKSREPQCDLHQPNSIERPLLCFLLPRCYSGLDDGTHPHRHRVEKHNDNPHESLGRVDHVVGLYGRVPGALGHHHLETGLGLYSGKQPEPRHRD